MPYIIFLFFAIYFPHNQANSHISEVDSHILDKFWNYATDRQLEKVPAQKRIPIIADFFLNYPYKSNTLNVTKKELPVINLRELDCVTLIENVLALSLLKEYNSNSTETFINNIIKLRYRNGEIIDYTSRLHYSTDWLYEMQKQKILNDITKDAGGEEYPHNIFYMSKNYTRYSVLNQNKKLIPKIKAIETEINKRTYYYIQKDKIANIYDKIENGDIILITTNMKGLDTSHLGFAVKKNGQVYLLHASSAGKKVMLTEVPLQEYMEGITSQTGIIIARINP